MKYGFTGSRVGPTKEQKRTLLAFILGSGDDDHIEEWHHGCCVGSDAWGHQAAKQCIGITVGTIHLHPPDNPKLEMAYTQWDYDNCIWSPKKDYLARDRDIVRDTDELVATPEGKRKPRSGTWYTIDYALDCGRMVNIIWPDGKLERWPHEPAGS